MVSAKVELFKTDFTEIVPITVSGAATTSPPWWNNGPCDEASRMRMSCSFEQSASLLTSATNPFAMSAVEGRWRARTDASRYSLCVPSDSQCFLPMRLLTLFDCADSSYAKDLR